MTLRAKLLSLVLLASLMSIYGITTSPASAAIEKRWKVKEAFLEKGESRQLNVKAVENTFILEFKPIVKVRIECQVTVAKAEIIGGIPGTVKANFSFPACKVLEPAKCTGAKLTTAETTGEAVEIFSNGRAGHGGVLLTIKNKPELTVEGCELAGPISGTVAADLGKGSVELEKLTWEFLSPAIETVKTAAGEEVKPVLKFVGSVLTFFGKLEAETKEKEKWGIY